MKKKDLTRKQIFALIDHCLAMYGRKPSDDKRWKDSYWKKKVK